MRIRTHHECMFPIAQINGHHLMQRSLLGARACDPIVPERPKRRRRREARQRAASRGSIAPWAIAPSDASPVGESSLKLRGTS
jgi:hypothetical protein